MHLPHCAGEAAWLEPFCTGPQQQPSCTWSWCTSAPRSPSAVHGSLLNTMCGVTCSMCYSTAPGLQSTGWGNQIPTLGTQLRNIRWFNSQMLSPVSGKKAETPQLLCYMSLCVTLSSPVVRVRAGVPGDSWQHRLLRQHRLTCPPSVLSFSVLQGCHQQRPFLRDACSTEKEGLLHKETLRVHQGTASP